MNPRGRMVEVIKREYGSDAPSVFRAMLQVPREEFVPEKFGHLAYEDEAVSVDFGQSN